jgi:signal transduction histidine kinase
MARVINHLLDRLEEAFVQLQRFTADAAHELRTPLASLRTIGEVALAKGHVSDEYREALGNILEETERLNATIDSLLMLARADITNPGSEHTDFSVADLIDEIFNLFEIVIEERNITVTHDGRPMQNVQVRVDRGLLRLAILNVLHNALKFSPDNSSLQISYSRIEGSSPSLRIAVQDEGPGIRSGEHQQIFERFFTSNARAAASHSGTGLGLSVAKLVIDRLGGNIWFDQEVKQGAKCFIELPISQLAR